MHMSGEIAMVASEVQGIDQFKIANRSISGWIPGLKTGTTLRLPFCSQLEERLFDESQLNSTIGGN